MILLNTHINHPNLLHKKPLSVNNNRYTSDYSQEKHISELSKFYYPISFGGKIANCKGWEHGIKRSQLAAQHNIPTKEDAITFLQQLKTIASLDNIAYTNLANQFRQINESEKFFVDINPNNLTVDVRNNKLSVNNLLDKTQIPCFENYTNDANTMITLILDVQMHTKFLEKLSDTQRKEMINASKTIIQKCKNACQQMEISPSKMSVADYFDNRNRFETFKSGKSNSKTFDKESFNVFCELYKYILPINTTNNNYCEQVDFKKLKSLFSNTKIIGEKYLPFLYEYNKINLSDLTEIIETNPNKISKDDINYFIENRVPLTRYDNEAVITNRLNCYKAKSYTFDSDEYKNNCTNIIKHELVLVDKAASDKKLIIVTGLPASGKSYFIKKENLSKDFYIADCDLIKEQFPAYIQNNAKSLNTLHGISRELLQQQILPYAVKNNKNIAIPTTGGMDYIEILVKFARIFGYNVEVVYIKNSPEKSMKNLVNRFMNTGRWVDPFFAAQRAEILPSHMLQLENSNLVDKYTIKEF